MLGVLRVLAFQAGVVISSLESGQPERALEQLKPLIKAAPADPQLLTLRGIALKSLRREDEALRSFRTALKARPGYLPALGGAAEIEYNSGKPEALAHLRRLVELAPDNPTAHAMLGVLEFEAARYDRAARHFEAGRPALGGNASALWMYGQALYQLKQYAGAATAFEQLMALAPGREEPRFNAALCRVAEGRGAEALALLEPLLARERPALAALRLAAAVYESQQDTARAIALLKRAVELYPREETAYLDLANLCLDHGGYDLGLEIVGAAIQNLGPTARLHAMRGILYVQSGHTEMAEADFEAARQLSPETGYGQVGLSITMMETDRIEESIRLLRDRVAANPRDATSRFVLAQALMKQGREPGTPAYDEAQRILETIVGQQPDHAPALALLGKILFTRGETARSIVVLKRALALQPRDRTATYQLMLGYGRTGETAKATEMQQRIRELIDQERKEELERNRVRLVKAPERERSS